jgi:hypothetical protein
MILLSAAFSLGRLIDRSESVMESFLAVSPGSVSLLMRPVGANRNGNAGDPPERCRTFIVFESPCGMDYNI